MVATAAARVNADHAAGRVRIGPRSTATLSRAVASAMSASPQAPAVVDRASSIQPSIAGLPDDRAASTASSSSDVASASRPSAVRTIPVQNSTGR